MEKNKHILVLFSSTQKEFYHNNKNRLPNKNIFNVVECPVIACVFKDWGSLTDKGYARLLHGYKLRKYIYIYKFHIIYFAFVIKETLWVNKACLN